MHTHALLAMVVIFSVTIWTATADDLAEAGAMSGKPTLRLSGETCTVFTHRELRRLIASNHRFRPQSPLYGKCIVSLGILETQYVNADLNFVVLIPEKPNSEIMAAPILLSKTASRVAQRTMDETKCANYRNVYPGFGLDKFVLDGVYSAWQAMTQNPCVFAIRARVTRGKIIDEGPETFALDNVRVGFVAQATLYEMDSEDLLQVANTAATVLK